MVDAACRAVASSGGVAHAVEDGVHPELVSVRMAAAALGRWRLPDLVLYTAMEPCSLCFAACEWVGIAALFYAVERPLSWSADLAPAVELTGAVGKDARSPQPLVVRGGLLADEAALVVKGV